ncbi:hypothetical protein J3458_020681 [Metarhizium acridum]|uniref:uncharacterized protein n=1 Tax=Metarhizium acridum TaxID=92637 RepID=UPI001C6AACD1|nr:hypothetical protein J3458_020681 [Metarhizium acridum]
MQPDTSTTSTRHDPALLSPACSCLSAGKQRAAQDCRTHADPAADIKPQDGKPSLASIPQLISTLKSLSGDAHVHRILHSPLIALNPPFANMGSAQSGRSREHVAGKAKSRQY